MTTATTTSVGPGAELSRAVPAPAPVTAGTTLASVMVDALLAGDTEAASNVALMILSRKTAVRA